MALADLVKELAALSDEEKKALGELMQVKEEKPKNPPAAPKARPVYFFLRNGDEQNPIGMDIRGASKEFWVRRKLQFVGMSDGKTWKTERESGKSVREATLAEYEACKKSGSKDPPPDLRRTDLGSGSALALERGMNNVLRANKEYDKASTENLDKS